MRLQNSTQADVERAHEAEVNLSTTAIAASSSVVVGVKASAAATTHTTHSSQKRSLARNRRAESGETHEHNTYFVEK